jgi:streptomycin 6-kinase
MTAPAPTLLTDTGRATLIERFGPQAGTWCDQLPDRVTAITTAWGLRVQRAFPAGRTSVVLRCQTRDEEPVVLKLTPDTTIAAAEETALDVWAGSRYVVALLDADTVHGALLLEALDPGTPLSADPDSWTLPDIAPLLTDLWRPRPIGITDNLPDLRDGIDLPFNRTQRQLRNWPTAAEHLPPEILDQARAFARTLAAGGPITLLHGDLHPGNVLRTERGLVAIDPRPCIGDRNFDAIDWVLAGTASRHDLERNIDQLTGMIAGLDPIRIWSWCQATAPILAARRLQHDPNDPHGRFLFHLATDTS